MVTRVLVLLLAAAAPAFPQYDPDAPDPIGRVRGSIVVYGAERAGHRGDFLERIEDGALVLLCAPREGDDWTEEAQRWARDDRPSPRVIAAPRAAADDEALADAITGADAVFLVGEPADLGRSYAGTAIGVALVERLEAGARVGARGETGRVLGALGLDERGGLDLGLGLFQGALFEPALPRTGGPGERLSTALESVPMFVGLGIEPRGLLVLEQRWLTGAHARALVLAGAERAAWTKSIGTRGARADLLSLSNAALARALRPWPRSDPAPPTLEQGTLMLGGGPMPADTFERFIELAGGARAPIVFVPCEYREAIDSEPRTVQLLRARGAEDVRWIHTKDRGAADGDPELLTALQDARGVWFGGGRQWNFVDSYLHTEVHRLVHAVLARGGVVGGSSAGASIQAEYMARGNPLGNLDIMAEGYEEGLGLLTGVAVDQHFSQRGRLPDLTSLVGRFPQFLGVGLDEGAVLYVRGSVAEVAGSAVHFLHMDAELVHHRLEDGQRFDLVRRRPID